MAHSFLLKPGKWTLQGTWITRDILPMPVKGKILVAWKPGDCFMVATKLSFPDSEQDDIVIQSRGRMTSQDRQYTFVMQHNLLGQVEGEGWIAPETIVQRNWGVSDKQRRSGFETLDKLAPSDITFRAAKWLVTTSLAPLKLNSPGSKAQQPARYCPILVFLKSFFCSLPAMR